MKKMIIFILSLNLVLLAENKTASPKMPVDHAQQIRVAREYNPEATQKLQALIDSLANSKAGYENASETAFLKDVNKLVKEGANPNIREKTNENQLMEIILHGTMYGKNKDFILLDDVLKTIIDNGGEVLMDPERPGEITHAIVSVPASTIKMLVKSGKDQKQIEQKTKNALEIVDGVMYGTKITLENAKNETDRLKAQKDIDSLNNVIKAIKPLTPK